MSLVATRWPLRDDDAAFVMERFYRGLAAGHTAGAALRRARGDVIEVEFKEAGKITSSVISPQLQRPIALGYVNKEFWMPGSAVSIGPSRRRATVASLPFLLSS